MAKEELLKIEKARQEILKIEFEKREREREERERIELEKLQMKKIQEQIKSTIIAKDFKLPQKNKKLVPFTTLNITRPIALDTKQLKLAKTSVVSSAMKKSKAHPSSKSGAGGADRVEQVNKPSHAEPSIKMPVSMKLANLSRQMGLWPDQNQRTGDHEASRESLSPKNGHHGVNPIDYDQVDADVQELRERIEQELKRKPIRPLIKHSRSRSRETPEREKPLTDRIRVHTNEGLPSEGDRELRNRPYPSRVHFVPSSPNPCAKPDLSFKAPTADSTHAQTSDQPSLRDRFYKNKSLIKLDMERHPRLYPKSGDGLSALEATQSSIGRNGSGLRLRGPETLNTPGRGSYYEMNRSLVINTGHSHCSAHASKGCCGKWDIISQAGKHCCHCYLIKSDIHNSNHRYNAAIVNLNAGSVLRSLIKETHCEENH